MPSRLDRACLTVFARFRQRQETAGLKPLKNAGQLSGSFATDDGRVEALEHDVSEIGGDSDDDDAPQVFEIVGSCAFVGEASRR
jgi:hypothetical protein